MSSKRKYRRNYLQSNSAFLTEPAVPIHEDDDESNLEEGVGEIPILLLTLETSGFEAHYDILHMAANWGKIIFANYVSLCWQVSATATAANGLMNYNGDHVYRGIKVKFVPIRIAWVTFVEGLGLF